MGHAIVMHDCPGCRQKMPARTWPRVTDDDGNQVQQIKCLVCKTTVNVKFESGGFDDSYDTPDHTKLVDLEDVDGDLIVDDQLLFGAKVTGDITVVDGGNLYLLGGCQGDVFVEIGGHAVIAGRVMGRVINRGGKVETPGVVDGGVIDET